MSVSGAVVRGVVGLVLVAIGWWLVDFQFGAGWQWGEPRWWIAATVQGYGYLTIWQAVVGFVRARRKAGA